MNRLTDNVADILVLRKTSSCLRKLLADPNVWKRRFLLRVDPEREELFAPNAIIVHVEDIASMADQLGAVGLVQSKLDFSESERLSFEEQIETAQVLLKNHSGGLKKFALWKNAKRQGSLATM